MGLSAQLENPPQEPRPASYVARYGNDGAPDTLVFVRVGDDFVAEAQHIQRLTVRVILSDPGAQNLPASKRLPRAFVANKDRSLYNEPLAKGMEKHVELRLNHAPLSLSGLQDGWLVFDAKPEQFAVGKNVVGVRVTKRFPEFPERISIEKMEVHVDYL